MGGRYHSWTRILIPCARSLHHPLRSPGEASPCSRLSSPLDCWLSRRCRLPRPWGQPFNTQAPPRRHASRFLRPRRSRIPLAETPSIHPAGGMWETPVATISPGQRTTGAAAGMTAGHLAAAELHRGRVAAWSGCGSRSTAGHQCAAPPQARLDLGPGGSWAKWSGWWWPDELGQDSRWRLLAPRANRCRLLHDASGRCGDAPAGR